MYTENNKECPSCWGFQEYDETQSNNKLCDCKNEE